MGHKMGHFILMTPKANINDPINTINIIIKSNIRGGRMANDLLKLSLIAKQSSYFAYLILYCYKI